MALNRQGALLAASLLLIVPACGGGGDDSAAPPMIALSVSPTSIAAGETVQVSWSSTNASTCSASGDWSGTRSTSGTETVSPPGPGTYTYTLQCSSGTSQPGTQSVVLTVSPAALAITPDVLTSGIVGTAYSQPVQVTGGVAPFSWTISDGALPHNLTLNADTTSTATISGIPDTAASNVAFAVTVTDAAQKTATMSYGVSILLQADTFASSGSLDFGKQLLGSTSGMLTETLTNLAGSDMSIAAIAILTDQGAATEFKRTGGSCGATLAAGASCTVSLTFTPRQRGPRAATLTVTDNTAGSPQGVPLTGEGLTSGPNVTFSVDTLPFGTELVGTSSPVLSVSLSNYGTDALSVSSVTTTSGFGASDECIPSVPSGSTCTIGVIFTPGSTGDVTGTLSVADDASGNPHTLALTGTGSTSTPLLTGNCVEACGIQVPATSCPAGLPAHSPGGVFRCGGPIISPSFVPVDRGRACFTGGSTRVGSGYCGTH